VLVVIFDVNLFTLLWVSWCYDISVTEVCTTAGNENDDITESVSNYAIV